MQIQYPKYGYKLVRTFGIFEEIPTEWEFKKLSETGRIIGGGTPDSFKKEYWNGDILWAVPTDITNLKGNFIKATERKITYEGLDNSSATYSRSESVLITSRATIGSCAINTIPLATNQGFQSLIPNSENNNLFILYAIRFHSNRLLRLAYGTTFLEISKSNIGIVRFPCPPLQEQQKIASIISKADELIQKTDQVIEQTQRLEKGLMQRLLARGIGYTEFKEVKRFSDIYRTIPFDWDIAEFNELIDDVRYGTSVKCTSESIGVPILRIPNVINGTIDFQDLKYATLSEKDVERYKLRNGDMLFIRTNGNREYVGRSAIFDENTRTYAFASYLIRVRLKSNRIIPHFANIQFSIPVLKKQLFNNAKTSAGQYNINTQGLKSLKVLIPPLTMQERILSNISNIIKNIQTQCEYRASLQLLKRGLMQKLLTGKIRVKV